MSTFADQPAFPFNHKWQSVDEMGRVLASGGDSGTGMTLRLHYAGLAMQGLCANNGVIYEDHSLPEHPDDCRNQIARAAVRIADALIAELERTKS